VADGNTGTWAAAAQVWPEVAEQRCWNHKIENELDKLLKKLQAEASEMLTEIPYAPTRAEAKRRRDEFNMRFRRHNADAVACLDDDWDRLVVFYDFPKEHWKHLRTTNVVESPFASVRLRTGAAKRFKKVPNPTVLIWKVLMTAERRFRRLNPPTARGRLRWENLLGWEGSGEVDQEAAEGGHRLILFSHLLT